MAALTLRDMTIPLDQYRTPHRDREAEARELKEHRRYFGISLERLAIALDYSPSQVGRWERAEADCPMVVLHLLRCWREQREREEASEVRTPRPKRRRRRSGA